MPVFTFIRSRLLSCFINRFICWALCTFLICYNDFKHTYGEFSEKRLNLLISAMIGLLFAFELEIVSGLKPL
jgi:hypothetical protein